MDISDADRVSSDTPGSHESTRTTDEEDQDEFLSESDDVSSDTGAKPSRMSHRKRKARLIDVDGHKVLRENNYDLEEGYFKVFSTLPTKPSRALSAYAFFQKRYRENNASDMADSGADALIIMADAWRNCGAAERQELDDLAAADKVRYAAESEQYDEDCEKAHAECVLPDPPYLVDYVPHFTVRICDLTSTPCFAVRIPGGHTHPRAVLRKPNIKNRWRQNEGDLPRPRKKRLLRGHTP
jgi:hypothetical protein